MRIRTTAPWLMLALLLTGCGSSSGVSATAMLAGAHACLEANDLSGAREYLDSASADLQSQRDRKEYALMVAELQLRTGDTARAAEATDQLLGMHPTDPRVQEVAGKTALLTADFQAAVWHFDRAMHGYYEDADVRRAADLLALARGFDAWSNGRVAAAEEHWQGIQEAQLRSSVLHASAAVGPGRADGALAGNFQSIR